MPERLAPSVLHSLYGTGEREEFMEDSDWLKNPQQEAFCLTEISWLQGFPDSAPAMQEPPFGSLGQEYSLGEEMATHSSILAWRILWTEEPGRLQSMRLQRVGHA